MKTEQNSLYFLLIIGLTAKSFKVQYYVQLFDAEEIDVFS